MDRARALVRGAASEVSRSQRVNEDDAVRSLLSILGEMRDRMTQQVGVASLSDFSQSHIRQLVTQIDNMADDYRRQIGAQLRFDFQRTSALGVSSAAEPLLSIGISRSLFPSLSGQLVQAAHDNTVDLLTLPMQQFRNLAVTRVRQIATGGIGNESRTAAIGALRGAILGKGFEDAAYRAERIVRTEVSRIFNGAAYDTLQNAAATPGLMKGWGAIGDSRTRASHTKADDDYRDAPIPVDDMFEVGDARLRFPLDPMAEPAGPVAARETINCRCSLLTDVNPDDLVNSIPGRISLAQAQDTADAEDNQ